MAKKGYSRRNAFGDYTHYDEKGRKVGKSVKTAFGDYVEYDEKGRKTGKTYVYSSGTAKHYDKKGRSTGTSYYGPYKTIRHYDEKGKRTGTSYVGPVGNVSHSDSEGCYIATCVYGSYEAPQVWTLRSFRDRYLKQKVWGRVFVRIYYAISPGLVSAFGKKIWFQNMWRRGLDGLVARLRARGY